MNNFSVIYRILRILDKNKGNEGFDYRAISAEALKISFPEWEQLLIELQINGYIRGILYAQDINEKFPHIVEPIQPRITLLGMEYLAENSMMAKAGKALQLMGEIL